jgi:transposase
MLVEAAWSYRYQPRVSSGKTDIVGRQPKPVRDIAWKAQIRLCSRYRKLAAVGKKLSVVITAIARELSGFVWAIGHAVRSGVP